MNTCRIRVCHVWLLACSCSLACAAQAPIERRDPPPLALGNREWPSGKTVHRGARLLVFSFDPYQPPSECRVREVAVDRLICFPDQRSGTVEFARGTVAALQRKPHASIAATLFKAGLITAGVGLACGVDGGPVCLTPEIIALGLITAGFVAVIVNIVRSAHGRYALPLYEAPSQHPAWPAGTRINNDGP